MAKITSFSPSSSSPSSSGASSSSSFSTGSHSSGKFASLSSFSGKFAGVSQPSLPTNRSGFSSSSELQLQTANGGGDAYQNTASSAVARLQRLVLQDRVMLSPSEANQSSLSVAEQGATPAGFFKTVCRALFGIALVPFLPFIGLYKLGDYGLASLRKGKNPPPPPPAGSMPPMPAPNQPMDQQSSQSPSANSAPPPMMTPPNNNNLTAQLPKTYGMVVNAPFQLADDGLIGSEPIPPVTFL
jgi:hypothetical protein